MMREGLRPLSSYIGIATAAYSAQNPDATALPEEVQTMLRGVQAYYAHPYKAQRGALDIVWQEGELSIGAVPEHEYKSAQPTLLLIPSLVNKADILDLLPQRSMLRWFAGQGIDPYLLDWGNSVDDAGQQSMEAVVQERLVPALEFLQQHNGGAPVHALGYCMGGTVLVGAATKAQGVLASVTCLAAPWDFHGGQQALLNRVKFWAPSAFPAIAEKGLLPVEWLQTLFASLDPTMMIEKFTKFAQMDPESERAELFIAVEDWLNDGVSLPADLAQHCIRNWFLKNEPMRGEWELGEAFVHPEDIECPVLVVASDKDRLVEYDSAAALAQQLKHPTIINPSCGHIGMIAGRSSVEKVWQPIAAWIYKHS